MHVTTQITTGFAPIVASATTSPSSFLFFTGRTGVDGDMWCSMNSKAGSHPDSFPSSDPLSDRGFAFPLLVKVRLLALARPRGHTTARELPDLAAIGAAMAENGDMRDFYLRYYVGHKGKFGHEFLEFELRPDGKLRYANNSNYRNERLIKKEAYVTEAVLREARKIVEEGGVLECDDAKWPYPDRVGKQELEVVAGGEHIAFTTSKIGSLLDVQSSEDPEGLRDFYYIVQDLKCFVFSLMSLHFKIKPL